MKMSRANKKIAMRGMAFLLSVLLCLGCVSTNWLGLLPGSSDGITTSMSAHAATGTAYAAGTYYDVGTMTVDAYDGSTEKAGDVNVTGVTSFLGETGTVTLANTTDLNKSHGFGDGSALGLVGATNQSSPDYMAGMPGKGDDGVTYNYVAKGEATEADGTVTMRWTIKAWPASQTPDDLGISGSNTSEKAKTVWDGMATTWDAVAPAWVSGAGNYSDWSNGTYTGKDFTYGGNALVWSNDKFTQWSVIDTTPVEWKIKDGTFNDTATMEAEIKDAMSTTGGIKLHIANFGAENTQKNNATTYPNWAFEGITDLHDNFSFLAKDVVDTINIIAGSTSINDTGFEVFIKYLNDHRLPALGEPTIDVGDQSGTDTQAETVSSDTNTDATGDTALDDDAVGGSDATGESSEGLVDDETGTITNEEDGEAGAGEEAAEANPNDGTGTGEDGVTKTDANVGDEPVTHDDPQSVSWRYPSFNTPFALIYAYRISKNMIKTQFTGDYDSVKDTGVGKITAGSTYNPSDAFGGTTGVTEWDGMTGYRIYGVESSAYVKPGYIWYSLANEGAGDYVYANNVNNACYSAYDNRYASIEFGEANGEGKYAKLTRDSWMYAYDNGLTHYMHGMSENGVSSDSDITVAGTMRAFNDALQVNLMQTEIYTRYDSSCYQVSGVNIDGDDTTLANSHVPMEIRSQIFFDLTDDYQRAEGSIEAIPYTPEVAEPEAITATAANTLIPVASESSVVTDTVTYKNLVDGKTYTLTGEIYAISDFDTNHALKAGVTPKASVEVKLKAVEGKETNPTTHLTDSAVPVEVTLDGDVIVEFPGFDTVAAAGETLVVRQTLKDEAGNVLSVHGSDETEEQQLTFPVDASGIITIATSGTLANSKYVDPIEGESIKDTVTLSKLDGGDYKLTGWLFRTDGLARIATTDVTSEVIHIADVTATTTRDMSFPLTQGIVDLVGRGSRVTVGQFLYKKDAGKLDDLIAGGTAVTAAGAEYEAWLTEVRAYADMILHVEDAPEGKQNLVTVVNDAQNDKGNIAGKDAVMTRLNELRTNTNLFIADGYELVMSHVEASAAQTVTIQRPVITTELTGGTMNVTGTLIQPNGNHTVLPGSNTVVIDTVNYEGLVPGATYEVKTSIMDMGTTPRQPISVKNANGEVTAEAVLTKVTQALASENGRHQVYMGFMFQGMANDLYGKRVVAHNELYRVLADGSKVKVADEYTEPEAQQVTFSAEPGTPNISTVARSAAGSTVLASGANTVITDTVTYTNLTVGTEYTLTGSIWDKTANSLVAGVTTTPYKFTPTAKDGSVSVNFTVDTTNMKGHSLVVYEVLSAGSTVVVRHEDPNDANQTVSVENPAVPTLDTLARGTNYSTVANDASATITDVVNYTGLTPNTRYTLTGRLYDKSTGKQITGTSDVVLNFTPTAANGSEVMTFRLDTRSMAGRSIVVGETLTIGSTVVATHVDMNDADQTLTVANPTTIYYPSYDDDDEYIDTVAVGDRNNHTMANGKNSKIYDTVYYYYLTPNTTYTLTGTLYNKSTGKPLAGVSPVVQTFTPTRSSGSVEMEFTLDTTGMDGTSIVVYETLNVGRRTVAYHRSLSDADQTVTVRTATDVTIPATTDPAISTVATDYFTGGKTLVLSKNATIRDTVSYQNLVAGRTYTMTATVYDKATGMQLPGTSAVTQQFTPAAASGSLEMNITIDSASNVGKTLVVFETVSYNGSYVCGHQDLNDLSQTVTVASAQTLLSGANTSGKAVPMSSSTSLRDTVYFSGLTVGRTYTVTGYIIDTTGPATATTTTAKSNTQSETVWSGEGEIVDLGEASVAAPLQANSLTLADGSVINYYGELVGTTSAPFTATSSSGSVAVDFNVNTMGRSGHNLVCLEVIMDSNYSVAAHADLNDSNQTVVVRTTASVQTGVSNVGFVASIVSVCLMLFFGAYTMQAIITRKRDDE